jgi:hypothetical protein
VLFIQKFTKLITALRSVVENGEGTLDKDATCMMTSLNQSDYH